MRGWGWAGVFLVSTGVAVMLAGLLVTGLAVHVAMGLGAAVVGATVLLVPWEERWRAVSSVYAGLVLDCYGCLEGFLKEAGAGGRAVFSPSREGVEVVLGNPGPVAPSPGSSLVARLVGEGLAAPGSVEAVDPGGVEAVLSLCLVELGGVCGSVSVSRVGGGFRVVLGGAAPGFRGAGAVFPVACRVLGSPLAAVAASAVCWATGRRVRVLGEEWRGGDLVVEVGFVEG